MESNGGHSVFFTFFLEVPMTAARKQNATTRSISRQPIDKQVQQNIAFAQALAGIAQQAKKQSVSYVKNWVVPGGGE